MTDKAKFIEEETGYRFNIVGRGVFVTEAMKSYAIEKLSKIDRFHNHVIDLHVTLDIQKMEHKCDVLIMLDHLQVKVTASSSDMYASIDRAVEKLQAKIRRWKSRIQDHHQKGLSTVDLKVNVLQRPFDPLEEINAEIELAQKKTLAEEYQPPKVIGTETKVLKILTTEEAIMKMELSDDRFMIFRGEEDHQLKVIYRRNDGNYGIIQVA